MKFCVGSLFEWIWVNRVELNKNKSDCLMRFRVIWSLMLVEIEALGKCVNQEIMCKCCSDMSAKYQDKYKLW